jgi:hypothetical protein
MRRRSRRSQKNRIISMGVMAWLGFDVGYVS